MNTSLTPHDFDSVADFKDTVAECFPEAIITSNNAELDVLDEVVDVRLYKATIPSGRIVATYWYNDAIVGGTIHID